MLGAVHAAVFAGLFAAATPNLTAAANVSGRPPECAPVAEGRRSTGPSVWASARRPQLVSYCRLLSHAQAQLASEPVRSLDDALAADAAMPGRAAPKVLAARALLRLERNEEASAAFEEALKRDPRAAHAPLALRDLATLELILGHANAAIASYRRLVPLVSLLPSREEAVRVLLEAAHASMAVSAAAREGSPPASALDEPLTFLREAARSPGSPLALYVALSLALALDRSGRGEEASALLRELDGAAAVRERPLPFRPAEARDRLVLEALALERTLPKEAALRYRQYLAEEPARSAWRSTTEARLLRLESARGSTPR